MVGVAYYITQTGSNVHNDKFVYEYLAVAADNDDELILIDFEGFAYDDGSKVLKFKNIDKVLEFIRGLSYMPYCDNKLEYKELKNFKLDLEKCL